MVLLGTGFLYDVTDPVHPKLLCKIANTSAHIFTGDTVTYLKADSAAATAVILHSMGSGNESVATHIPTANLESASTWWASDGSVAAEAIMPTNPSAGDKVQLWVHTPSFTGVIDSYLFPLTDCICRFGIPPAVLAISPDHQYLVAGWPFKGAAPLIVYRLSDRSRAYTFDPTFRAALWDKTGHRLFATGNSGSASWTPESGLVQLSGAGRLEFLPGLSPDASQIAFSAYLADSDPTSLRVFVYDVKTDKVRMLRDALRSQAVFVKDGWVWYLEEGTCDASDATCPPWRTKPTGKVQAMNLADGVERQVDFQYAEDANGLLPGEYWPSS